MFLTLIQITSSTWIILIPFSFHSSQTLEKVCTMTIHVCASTTETKHATLTAAVTARGKMLLPLLILKGKMRGHIARKEFQMYTAGCFYANQNKASMDVSMMISWIDLVLMPWSDTIPPEFVKILIFDAYCIHMMCSTMT